MHLYCKSAIECFVIIVLQSHQLNVNRESERPMTSSRLLCIGISTPEAKLLFLFSYYILTDLVILAFGTALMREFDSTLENLESYFTCSIAGYRPECDTYKANIEDTTRVTYYLKLPLAIMLCSINLSSLAYTTSVIKKVCLCKK